MTKKKIAHQQKSSKSSRRRSGKAGAPGRAVSAEMPVDDEIRRAATRAGINPETGLAPDEQAAFDQTKKIGLPVSAYARAIVKGMRAKGRTTEEVAYILRAEARDLEAAAERLTPEPETRDAMLKDALEIVEAATAIFDHDGSQSDLLSEALRSASDDIELFESASSNGRGGANEMAYLRAEYRIRLALKIHAFRERHPSWKPVKVDNDDSEVEQAAGGAS